VRESNHFLRQPAESLCRIPLQDLVAGFCKLRRKLLQQQPYYCIAVVDGDNSSQRPNYIGFPFFSPWRFCETKLLPLDGVISSNQRIQMQGKIFLRIMQRMGESLDRAGEAFISLCPFTSTSIFTSSSTSTSLFISHYLMVGFFAGM